MFVGEIGIPRTEYLYELQFVDLLLISRGYFNRLHPGWEQARLVAYNAHYCMGSKTTPPTVDEWLPFPWENSKSDLPSDDKVEEMRKQYQKMNEELAAKKA